MKEEVGIVRLRTTGHGVCLKEDVTFHKGNRDTESGSGSDLWGVFSSAYPASSCFIYSVDIFSPTHTADSNTTNLHLDILTAQNYTLHISPFAVVTFTTLPFLR
jgi:hypothetical protein